MKLDARERKATKMPSLLSKLPAIINSIFDVLDLLIVRIAILALSAMGLWTLLRKH